MVKEFTKTIRKLQREFQREINKLEMNNKKIQNEITRMVQKKEPRVDFYIKNFDIYSNLECYAYCRTEYFKKQQLSAKISQIRRTII